MENFNTIYKVSCSLLLLRQALETPRNSFHRMFYRDQVGPDGPQFGQPSGLLVCMWSQGWWLCVFALCAGKKSWKGLSACHRPLGAPRRLAGRMFLGTGRSSAPSVWTGALPEHSRRPALGQEFRPSCTGADSTKMVCLARVYTLPLGKRLFLETSYSVYRSGFDTVSIISIWYIHICLNISIYLLYYSYCE